LEVNVKTRAWRSEINKLHEEQHPMKRRNGQKRQPSNLLHEHGLPPQTKSIYCSQIKSQPQCNTQKSKLAA